MSQEIILGRPWSEENTKVLLRDLLEVLAFVHENHIIHRDIKPANIMRRDRDRKLVLIDFGAVKEINVLQVNAQGQTSLTVSIGSPGYMSAEQAIGKPKFASDLYGVGRIALEALTGLELHNMAEDPSTGDIIWRPHTQVSPQFGDFLDKMVKDHFSSRYPNAGEA